MLHDPLVEEPRFTSHALGSDMDANLFKSSSSSVPSQVVVGSPPPSQGLPMAGGGQQPWGEPFQKSANPFSGSFLFCFLFFFNFLNFDGFQDCDGFIYLQEQPMATLRVDGLCLLPLEFHLLKLAYLAE